MTENNNATNAGHWHVATGLAGYGPDASDGYGTATDIESLASLISYDLDQCADSEHDAFIGSKDMAKQYRESGNVNELDMLRDMLTSYELSVELDALSQNFGENVKNSMLYKDNPTAWEERILQMVGETFPKDIAKYSRLYVWECTEGASCESLIEE